MVDFTKVLIIVLSINLLLFVGGVRVVESDTTNFLNRFVDTDAYTNSSLVVVGTDLQEAVPVTYETKVVDNQLSFIDVVGAVAGFLIFLVNILFTPVGLIMGTGLPPEVGMLFGIPLMFGLVMGFIYMVRSGK